MNIGELEKPSRPINGDLIFGTPIDPQSKLETISDKEFELMVTEWAYGYLKKQYFDVYRLGNSGDKGRDLIAYYTEKKDKFDIYQCKHYGTTLSPSQYWVEFGKLCYYTFNGDYKVPQKYYIVTSKGVGQDMRDLIDNPAKINNKLIENWERYCENKKIISEKIHLDNKLKNYINSFDFSIVIDISPIKLLEQYRQTPWFKYRFGGGLVKRPISESPPDNVSEEESLLLYIQQLVLAYKEQTNGEVTNIQTIKTNSTIFDHFTRQRECFYSAQTLKRFARDELIDENLYNGVKKEIHYSVVDTCNLNYENGYQRANATLDKARQIPIDINELGKITPSDKSGVCHELVNDNKIKWVK